jgi:hypothetical protein
MSYLETRFLATQKYKPLEWWRFIDDIFMIWAHPRQELYSFLEAINSFHKSIKFTYEVDTETAHFLDVTITKDSNGYLNTTVYTKPTDAHLYLHYSSYHPDHQKNSIPYSQAVRIRRICSDQIAYEECTRKLETNLTARGYPLQLIKKAIKKASALNRDELLLRQNKPIIRKTIPFTYTFNPKNPPVSKLINTLKNIL